MYALIMHYDIDIQKTKHPKIVFTISLFLFYSFESSICIYFIKYIGSEWIDSVKPHKPKILIFKFLFFERTFSFTLRLFIFMLYT